MHLNRMTLILPIIYAFATRTAYASQKLVIHPSLHPLCSREQEPNARHDEDGN